MAHSFILYVHILAATLLIGSSVAARAARRVMLGATDLTSLRAAAEVARRISLANPAIAMVLLATGLYLGGAGFWRAAWFWVAVAAWAVSSVLAGKVLGPSGRRLGVAAARAGNGAIPPQVEALRRARAPVIAADVLLGLDLSLLLLMVAKPAVMAAIVWPLLGVGLALALGYAGEGLAARRARAGQRDSASAVDASATV
ncbi:MAG: hypothetical protein HS128_02055 [Ideonella sp.]|nr:hypothetical protein [Ideonella sp.]MCC7458524.1 hypothetical protein [Nitrospira sp.]